MIPTSRNIPRAVKNKHPSFLFFSFNGRSLIIFYFSGVKLFASIMYSSDMNVFSPV